MTAIGSSILGYWRRLGKNALGRRMFGIILRAQVPYTGTIAPEVLDLEPGFCRIQIQDRQSVRNHLGSIHAAALMNLCEAATGLAFVTSLPTGVKAIVTSFTIDYLKKARGTLVAECRCAPPGEISTETQHRVEGVIRNAEGDIVARGTATWQIRPE